MNNIAVRKCRKRRKREMTERKRWEPREKEKNMKACTKKTQKRSNPVAVTPFQHRILKSQLYMQEQDKTSSKYYLLLILHKRQETDCS